MTDEQPSASARDAGIRRMLLRSSSLAWMASGLLLAIAILLAVAWLYSTIRTQAELEGFASGPYDDVPGGPSILERLDAMTRDLYFLAEAGLVTGAGFGLRILGDLGAVRAGGPVEDSPER
jgi:hypothetical protein